MAIYGMATRGAFVTSHDWRIYSPIAPTGGFRRSAATWKEIVTSPTSFKLLAGAYFGSGRARSSGDPPLLQTPWQGRSWSYVRVRETVEQPSCGRVRQIQKDIQELQAELDRELDRLEEERDPD
jgi:hypothetical protein